MEQLLSKFRPGAIKTTAVAHPFQDRLPPGARASRFTLTIRRCRSKTKKIFGRKNKPDSPKLPVKQNSTWGLEEQEQWVRQEPAGPAHPRAASTHTGSNPTVVSPQQDWFSTAMQQSAQLTDLEKKEEPVDDTLLSRKDKQKQNDLRRRTSAAQPAPPKEDWFDVALQQSAQLDQAGPRLQTVV